MRFLIDGYNLLHAIGWAAKPNSGISWERSRLRMLNWLSEVHGPTAHDVWIIFDAHRVVHSSPDEIYRNLNIGFSKPQETADDRIEAMIATETHPSELAIVSNDTRIQKAAKRRDCPAWTCERYVDWLVDLETRAPAVPPVEEEPEKQENATEAEMSEWLRVFEDSKKRVGKRNPK